MSSLLLVAVAFITLKGLVALLVVVIEDALGVLGGRAVPSVMVVFVVVSAWLSKGRCTFSNTLSKHKAKSQSFSSSGAPTKGSCCGEG